MLNRMLPRMPLSAVLPAILPAINIVMTNIAKKIPVALTLAAESGIAASMVYAKKREHDVKAEKFNSDCNGIIKDASQFEVIGTPNHGSLSSKVIRDINTGNEYVEKAAHSRKDLVKEFMYANFLHAVRKDQPECLILQREDNSGTHFHTLSRKHQNSQDIESFIRSGRGDELKNKKVIGLEESLAADQIIGKQSDTKLANLVISETNDTLKISTIDNERAMYPGAGFFNIDRMKFPVQPSTLVNAIHDLSEPSDDNLSGLAGDDRAKEFGKTAMSLMMPKKITDYYADVAKADINPVIQDCYNLAAHSTLFKSKECAQYRDHFRKIQEAAAQHAAVKSTKP